jgi:hypothetical protein
MKRHWIQDYSSPDHVRLFLVEAPILWFLQAGMDSVLSSILLRDIKILKTKVLNPKRMYH